MMIAFRRIHGGLIRDAVHRYIQLLQRKTSNHPDMTVQRAREAQIPRGSVITHSAWLNGVQGPHTIELIKDGVVVLRNPYDGLDLYFNDELCAVTGPQGTLDDVLGFLEECLSSHGQLNAEALANAAANASVDRVRAYH